MKKFKILGLIPARGGSKGVHRKNIRALSGKPLIRYTIEEALRTKYLTKVVTTTDDHEIAQIAKKAGSDIIKRPKRLATDKSLVINTIKHALDVIADEEGMQFDYVILLQPTSPLRTAEDIDNAINLMIKLHADSVVSLTEVGHNHPAKIKGIVNDRIIDTYDKTFDFTPRQQLPDLFIRNGAIFGARTDIITNNNTLRGNDCAAYVMPPERSVNIDTEADLVLAAYYFAKQKNNSYVRIPLASNFKDNAKRSKRA